MKNNIEINGKIPTILKMDVESEPFSVLLKGKIVIRLLGWY